jgi:cystathionine beta-synthase
MLSPNKENSHGIIQPTPIYKSLLQAIGNTPLVQIKFDTAPTMLAKLEYLNPGGSLKDRSALFMIEDAERKGTLKPGGTIIEASSGNQGIAAAMIGAYKGYKVIITASEKVSKEKLDTLRAYGVQVVLCSPTAKLDDPGSYYTKAVEIHKNTPNSIFLGQYYNPTNSLAHYSSLGPEVYEQTNGTVTHFVAAAGSCGHSNGAGKYLKEKNKDIKVLPVDTQTSWRATEGQPKPYALEGIGVDYDTPLYNKAVVDEFLNVTDEHAIAMLKTMARSHGLLIGPSSGAVAYAAYEYSKKLPASAVVVMVFGDSGRAYLTKNFYQD